LVSNLIYASQETILLALSETIMDNSLNINTRAYPKLEIKTTN